MAVIKANAYGHEMLHIARTLSNADAFAVASIDEAIFLRQQQIHQEIVVLEGFNHPQELKMAIEHRLIVVVHDLSQLQWIDNANIANKVCQPLNIWLKMDTGMHRLGFQEAEMPTLAEHLQKLQYPLKIRGLMSHFANADTDHHSLLSSSQQLQLFHHYIAVLRQYLDYKKWEIDKWQYSLANSAAIISLESSHLDWVRPGIMLYGVQPLSQTQSNISLQPVMTLKSTILSVRQLKKGDHIGYGSDWTCPQDMAIATIAIGYADGYPRHAQTGTPVLIKGVITPLVGRVSMDMITVDLRPLQEQGIEVKAGDEAILWGNPGKYGKHCPTVGEVAEYATTIAYELLCQLGGRVNYLYLD